MVCCLKQRIYISISNWWKIVVSPDCFKILLHTKVHATAKLNCHTEYVLLPWRTLLWRLTRLGWIFLSSALKRKTFSLVKLLQIFYWFYFSSWKCSVNSPDISSGIAIFFLKLIDEAITTFVPWILNKRLSFLLKFSFPMSKARENTNF